MATALRSEDFFWVTHERAEDMLRYVPGGYHPVKLGDVFVGRFSSYYIMHKVGYGSYATVWLGQDTQSRRYVAVKITTADEYSSSEHEACMLQAAQNHANIVTFIDSFTVNGPNGTHAVLVSELLAPLLELRSMRKRRPAAWYKAIARGLTEGVAHLHALGIVHGDLHLGNVGLTIPGLDAADPFDVCLEMDHPEVTVVLNCNHKLQTASFPPYLIAPSSLAAYYNRVVGVTSQLPGVKIFDFGAAHRLGSQTHEFQCAPEACAPELAFARVAEHVENPAVEEPCDVWALGALIFEVVSGHTIFDGVGLTGLPFRMAKLAGSVSPAWKSALPSTAEATIAGADKLWTEHRASLRHNCLDDDDVDKLVSLLRRILVLDPTARPTAAQLLLDPWFEVTRLEIQP